MRFTVWPGGETFLPPPSAALANSVAAFMKSLSELMVSLFSALLPSSSFSLSNFEPLVVEMLVVVPPMRAHGFSRHLRTPGTKSKMDACSSLLSPPDHDLRNT